jgi:hypothetical protein
VLGPNRRSVEYEQSATLENPIDDGLGEVFVVEDATPGTELLVCGEDHRAFAAMTLVDDVEEHVGGISAVR